MDELWALIIALVLFAMIIFLFFWEDIILHKHRKRVREAFARTPEATPLLAAIDAVKKDVDIRRRADVYRNYNPLISAREDFYLAAERWAQTEEGKKALGQ